MGKRSDNLQYVAIEYCRECKRKTLVAAVEIINGEYYENGLMRAPFNRDGKDRYCLVCGGLFRSGLIKVPPEEYKRE